MIRLCIFDLDGTLIDSLEDLADCCNAVLLEHGLPPHPLDAYRHFVGDGIPKLIERILPKEKRVEQMLIQVREEFDQRYQIHCLDRTKPYEGIMDLLKDCRERGLLLSVLSNKADAFAKSICSQVFGGEMFDAIRGQKPELPKKPAPDGVFSLLQEFSLSAAEAVLIGDSNVDILTAQNAQIHAVGACWGFRGREELKRAGAKLLALSPKDCGQMLFDQKLFDQK